MQRPDFLVWLDAFEPLFGGPVLAVDVLVHRRSLAPRLEQLFGVARSVNVSWVLVVVADGEVPSTLEVNGRGQNLLVVSVRGLIDALAAAPAPAAFSRLIADAADLGTEERGRFSW